MGGTALKGRTYEEIYGPRADEMRKVRAQGRWKGGRYSDGLYWYVYCPGHHLACDKYAPEHLLIAERILGRRLFRDDPRSSDCEVVHHLNGDGHDNRPENLLVCTRKFHTKLHQTIRTFFERLHFVELKQGSFTQMSLDSYLVGFGLDPSKVRFLGAPLA